MRSKANITIYKTNLNCILNKNSFMHFCALDDVYYCMERVKITFFSSLIIKQELRLNYIEYHNDKSVSYIVLYTHGFSISCHLTVVM